MNEVPEVRFVQLMKGLGAAGHIHETARNLFNLYADPKRAYHDIQHIIEGLEAIDELVGSDILRPQLPTLLELAWWYHDAVYETKPHEPTNEEASAELCLRDCRELRMSLTNEFGNYVRRLILSTSHSIPVNDYLDQQIIVDIDLLRLAAPPERFDFFCQAIANEYSEEYSDYTAEQYRQGRIQFLQGMLARPRIYRTDYFRDKYEVQARINLRDAIERLKQP